MNIVSCYRASQIAQVSKQAISEKRQVKIDGKYKYKYFGHDKNSGDFGVDLDHVDWKRYMDKRRSSRGFDKSLDNMQSKPSKSQASQGDQQETVIKKHFAQALVNALRKQYKKTDSEIRNFLLIVQDEYDKFI